ncbi:restriction endonuclease subunit S [Fusobacterium varium]
MAREMKDSGVEWIGKIPEEWKIGKIKNICNLYVGNSIKDNEKQNYQDNTNALPYISTKDINISNSVINYENGMYTKINDSNFKIAKKNSTLLCIEGGSAGKKISYLSQDVSFVNKLCCFEGKEKTIKKYLYYFIKSESFKSEFKLNISGLIGGVSQNLLKNFSIIIPNLEEQEKIANYLDKKVADIDLIIEKTKATIEEYKKYKQSIITEAVIKGLNPDVEMKNSGIEEIPKIPFHWNIKKIKYVLKESNERTKTGKEEPLSMSQKYGLIPTKNMDRIPNIASSFENCKIVYKEDLVFNKLKAHLGVFSKSDYDGIVSPDYAVYRSKINIDIRYLEFLFKTKEYISQFIKFSRGVAQGLTRLYTEEFFNIYIIFPCFEEQQQIVEYLDKKVSEIDRLISKKESLVNEMEEYKKSLIYECVTGKKEII